MMSEPTHFVYPLAPDGGPAACGNARVLTHRQAGPFHSISPMQSVFVGADLTALLLHCV